MKTQDDLIIEYLHDADWVTAKEIAEAIGQPKEEIELNLEQLQREGKVDHYRSGYPLKWGLTDVSHSSDS